MAKGGYERRRIQQKKQQEREARKRAQRRKLFMTWATAVTAIGLVGGIVVGVILNNDDSPSLLDPTASGSPSSSAAPGPCPASDIEPQTGKKTYSKPPAMKIDTAKTYTATIKTSCGDITVDLLDNAAPKTVNNFVFLAREGFYDKTIFHRVIPDFGGPGSDMVQAGDGQRGNGTGDAGYKFEDENMIPFDQPGYLAMANSGPGTNGSQFFLLSGKVTHLNAPGQQCPGQGCHSVFGKVTNGLEILGKIADMPRDASDKPNTNVIIESITIAEK